MDKKKDIYLPRCVTKKELANYFGVKSDYLREQILTEDLIQELGFSYARFKKQRIIGPRATKAIYKHFEISNLWASLLEELAEETAEAT